MPNCCDIERLTLLTVHVETDPLADGGRDVVPGDAEVGPHLRPAGPGDGQVLALVLLLAPLAPGRVADDVLAVLPPPGDPRGGVARGRAHQSHVLALLDHHVLAGLEIVDLRRHVDVETPVLLLHLLGVDLTHVAASVRLQHGAEVKLPDLESSSRIKIFRVHVKFLLLAICLLYNICIDNLFVELMKMTIYEQSQRSSNVNFILSIRISYR